MSVLKRVVNGIGANSFGQVVNLLIQLVMCPGPYRQLGVWRLQRMGRVVRDPHLPGVVRPGGNHRRLEQGGDMA